MGFVVMITAKVTYVLFVEKCEKKNLKDLDLFTYVKLGFLNIDW